MWHARTPRVAKWRTPITLSGAQTGDERDEIFRHRRLEAHVAIVERMAERQPERVERLPRKRNGAERVRPVDIALFADQGVTPQPRLDPNLIPLSSHQAHFDQRRHLEWLDHAVVAD